MRNCKNTLIKYGIVAMTFHWLTALLILAMFVLGFGREFVFHGTARVMMEWHRSIGILIIALTISRLIWRFMISAPPDLSSLSPPLQNTALFVHFLLYVFLVIMPLTGWAMTNAAGRSVILFRLIPLFAIASPNKALAETLENIHSISAYILLILIILHSAAAFYYHYGRKDDILRRMLPSCGDN